MRNLVVCIDGPVELADLAALRDQCERLDVVLGARASLDPESLRNLGIRVFTDAFAGEQGVRVPHIELARDASRVLVLAASPHTVAALATGACSDLTALVVTATRAPVVVVLSEADRIWSHPAVQRNLEQLRADGIRVVDRWSPELLS